MERTEYRFIQTQLWQTFMQKSKDEHKEVECQNVKEKCVEAINILKTIRDTFPTYTLHDETHSINILDIMAQILGDQISQLTSFESALLILSAFYHDSGMVVKEEEKDNLIEDGRFKDYLNKNPYAFNCVYESGLDKPMVNNEIVEWYYRTIHHERVWSIIPEDLLWEGLPYKNILAHLCESHGWDTENLIINKAFQEMPEWFTADIRFCSILLRLSDILDFDNVRAPYVLYALSNFKDEKNEHDKVSNREWSKQIYSLGFKFPAVREPHYLLPFAGNYNDIQIEYDARNFLDTIDNELNKCSKILVFCPRWTNFVLPQKIDRSSIRSNGYRSGEFCLKINQDKIIQLFAGENLYKDPMSFVRELLQNAIDTVRTRKIFENSNCSFIPRIDITTWMDDEGFHWFRIDDNGMGMNEEKILKYFLNIGSSYYNSEDFKADKIKHLQSQNVQSYMPISRFGIGILSCFLCGDRIEVSTKDEDGQQLRLSIPNMKGYYMVMCAQNHHAGLSMPSRDKNGSPYRFSQGTTIAVRINLYNIVCKNLKEIVKEYLSYPEIPILFNNEQICTSEHDFLKEAGKYNDYEIRLTEEQIDFFKQIPQIEFDETPLVRLRFIRLSEYVKSNSINGLLTFFEFCYKLKNIGTIKWCLEEIELYEQISMYIRNNKLILNIQMNPIVECEEIFDEFVEDNEYSGEYELEIIDLADLDFPKNFFINTKYGEYTLGEEDAFLEVAHNGIVVEKESSLIEVVNNILIGVVLLKDNHRPEVNLSRTEVTNYSIETMLEFFLLMKKLKNKFNIITTISYNIDYLNFEVLYRKLLENKDVYIELMENCIVKTNAGLLPICTLFSGTRINLDTNIDSIERAILQLNFNIKTKTSYFDYEDADFFDYSWERIKEIIIDKRESILPEEYDYFPPLFFVDIIDSSHIIRLKISNTSSYSSYIINERHPLSKWLLQNAKEIMMIYNAIFKEIVISLRDNDVETVITSVNTMLNIMKSNGKFPVSDELYLSKKNFYLKI